MNRSICFLRSVNMAGHNKIKMSALTQLFSDEGFSDVLTYIQSGNIIFTDPGKRNDEALSGKIEKAISKAFNLNVSAVIRSVAELEHLTSRNPYLSEKDFNPSRMGVVFLRKEPLPEAVKKMDSIDFPPDKFEISGKEIFLFCPHGFGRSKLSTNFFENKMKVTGTARNWQTIMKILDLAKNETE